MFEDLWDQETDEIQKIMLPLLKTCHRVYEEAIDILYNENHFNMRHLDNLSYLSETTLPKTFNNIRYLSLAWSFLDPYLL